MFSENLTFNPQKENRIENPGGAKKVVNLLLPPIIPKALRRLSKKLMTPVTDIVPVKWSEFDSFAELLCSGGIFPEIKKALGHNDLVILNGEGCIYGVKRESRLIYFLAYVSKKYFKKPTAIVNHTADLGDPVLMEIARNVYPLLDDVVFRESVSAQRCKDITKFAIAADAAFVYRPMRHDEWIKTAARPGYFDVFPNKTYDFDPSKPYICLGGSSVFLRPETIGYDPVPGYLKLINELKREHNQIVLTASAATDEEFMRPISREYKIPLIGLHTSIRQAIDILGNSSVYIGGRWHPSIFALSGGTPIIPLSAFTFKMKALMNEIELDIPVIDSLKLEQETEKIVRLCKLHSDNGEDLRRLLKTKSDKYAMTSRRNVDLLKTASVQSNNEDSSCYGKFPAGEPNLLKG